MREITDTERQKLREKLEAQHIEVDGEYAESVVDPDKTALPIDSALEVEVSAVPANAFDDSHYHLVSEGFVLHLDTEDSSEFDREIFEGWMVPMLAEEMGVLEEPVDASEDSDDAATFSVSFEVEIPEVLQVW